MDGTPNTRFSIYDLTCECLDIEDTVFEGGKIYLPPVLDVTSGFLHIYQGYGDSFLTHEKVKLGSLFCKCRSIEFAGGATTDYHGSTKISPPTMSKARPQYLTH